MSTFWVFARRMLRYKRTLAWALFFALVSAGGVGAGLMSLGSILGLARPEAGGLQTLATEYNARDPIVAVPGWLIEMLPEDRFRGVVMLVVALGLLTLIGAVGNFLHQYLSMTIVAKTIAGVRRDCFRRVMHMPLGRVITRGPSEFVARIIRDAAELQGGLIALTSKSVAQVTKGVAAMIVAFWYSWQMAAVAMVVAPPLIITMRKLGKRIRRGTRGSLAAQEELLRIASESLRGLHAVKANTGERQASARFHQKNKQVIEQELRVRLARAMSGPIVEMLAILVVGTLAIIATRQIMENNLDFRRVLMSIATLGVAGAAFKPLAGLINEMQASSAPAGRLLDLLGEPREVMRDESKTSLPRHRESLVFRDVSFTYEGGQRPALDGVDLEIQHGEKVAIVGPNGSGKTTLLMLVPRLLRPQSGTVLIDGVDIADVNVRGMRRQIGVVTQETVLFRGSVAENIAFGAGIVTRQDVVAAAKKAHADEFIRMLPEDYDTELAEQGASLSGGQRQRLAIARAILRDPSILILDEATSQIDSESEALINRAITEFSEGRTALLIAHRLSTVLTADRIVVMDEGRVVDEGSHDELLERCEVYRRLARNQLVGAG